MKKSSRHSKFIECYLELYRCTVLITYETEYKDISSYLKKRKFILAPDWKKAFEELRPNALGVCMDLKENNPDVLVWISKKPTNAKEYGTLYHEIHHATDLVLTSHNMRSEREAAAYIFEFIVNTANHYFWK